MDYWVDQMIAEMCGVVWLFVAAFGGFIKALIDKGNQPKPPQFDDVGGPVGDVERRPK